MSIKLILENWRKFQEIKEINIAPKIYDNLKKKGQLPPGAVRAAPESADKQTAPKQKSPSVEKNFDDQTGKPITKKGIELCKKNPECKEKHLSGGRESPDGPNRFQMAQILGKNYLQLKRSLDNVPDNAMLADEVKKDFEAFEFKFLTFLKQFRGGR